MANDSYRTASTTLDLLEERLRRIDYILHGDNPEPTDTPEKNDISETIRSPASAADRLRKLERSLATLRSKSPTVTEILDLQSSRPSLFHPSKPQQQAPDLPSSSLAALVLAHAHLYQSTSTKLQTLHSNPSIPDPTAFAKLTALQPRIDAVRRKQEEQGREFAELRRQSASVVERWYEEGVLGMGEKWAGWEERLREGEILVRRMEARGKREREGVV